MATAVPAAATPAGQPAHARAPLQMRSGPLEKVYAFWLAGMSCDGCSIAAVGATQPTVEDLLLGALPGLPRVELYHPVLAVEAGHAFVEMYRRAWKGQLDAPYVIIVEGSIPDETIANREGGYWSGLGVEGGEHDPYDAQPVPTAEWVRRLAPGAAASVAIGTCATWGGVPAAAGNVTGSMGLMDFLGKDYRSLLGLPVVNIPGCSPVGDNFTETIAAVLMFLQGLGPLPEFDELGRPAWLFDQTVHLGCTRGGFYEEGTYAEEYGGKECLVEVGCWGPVVKCNIGRRGAINHLGGCMNVGAICIGCTMPGFPDRFAPFYKRAPGTFVSSSASRTHGFIIRTLRHMTAKFMNRSHRWDVQGEVPSGWGHVAEPWASEKAIHYFYKKLQYSNTSEPGAREY